MPTWIPPTIILLCVGTVVVLAFAGVFSETESRRKAAYSVLRLLLPWMLVAIASQLAIGISGI